MGGIRFPIDGGRVHTDQVDAPGDEPGRRCSVSTGIIDEVVDSCPHCCDHPVLRTSLDVVTIVAS